MSKTSKGNEVVRTAGRGWATVITGSVLALLTACGGSESSLSLPDAATPTPTPAPTPTPTPPPAPAPQPPAAPTITQQPSDASVTVGSAAAFTVAATAGGTVSILWQQSLDNGTNWAATSTTDATLSLPAVALEDNGKRFRARVCNVVGALQTCVDSSVALLTVTAPPPPPPPPVNPFPAGSIPIVADDGVHGPELWITDGTEAGTRLVKDIRPGSGGSTVSSLTLYRGLYYFAASDGDNGTELWKTDGTEAGTSLVIDLKPGGQFYESRPFALTVCNDSLFFGAEDATGAALFKKDGTAAGTVRLASVIVGGKPACLNNVLVFQGGRAETGSELWRSDGTPAGTTMLLDIEPGKYSSNPDNFTEFGGKLFFTAQGRLWKTDGTTGGTVKVSDAAGDPRSMVVNGSTLYFSAADGLGYELWKTDGTSAGTVLIKDLNAGSPSSYPYRFTVLNGIVYFGVQTSPAGSYQLWRTDGTEAGTYPVTAISPGYVAGYGGMVEVSGYLIFDADQSGTGSELWRTDGTAGGTVRLMDIRPGTVGSYPKSFIRLGTSILFRADSGIGDELWITDGTAAGTRLVKDICEGTCSSVPGQP